MGQNEAKDLRNRKTVEVRDLNSLDLVMEIRPRHIKAISLVQLSPSARHIVVGND